MVKLGLISDTHFEEDSNNTNPGPITQFPTDFDDLLSRGCTDIYHGGDLAARADQSARPHVIPECYDVFYDEVLPNCSDPSALRAVIPGNHDVPLPVFLEADDRHVLRKRIDYDSAGVSVFLLNTQATGYSTGGNPGSRNGAIGPSIPRIPYRDIRWLDEQLADAGDNAKLIIPHAAPYGVKGGNFGGTPAGNNNLSASKTYWTVENGRYFHEVVSQYSKVTVPYNHIYTFGASDRGAETVDDVEYVQRQHYYHEDDDEAHDYALIDIDSTQVDIDIYSHNDTGIVAEPLDKTF